MAKVKCTRTGWIAGTFYEGGGAEYDADDPNVVAIPSRFVPVAKKAKKATGKKK